MTLAWALDNYPNAGEGGIRKIGITESSPSTGRSSSSGGPPDAEKVWDAFHTQAAKTGYRDDVYKSGNDPRPSLITPEDHKALLAIPRSDAARLLAELSRRAAGAIEELMTRLASGFAYGFVNEIWRAYWFDHDARLSHGRPVRDPGRRDHSPPGPLMKKLGLPGAKDQNTDGRIIWPGSIFIDPKVASHQVADYTDYREVGKVTNPHGPGLRRWTRP